MTPKDASPRRAEQCDEVRPERCRTFGVDLWRGEDTHEASTLGHAGRLAPADETNGDAGDESDADDDGTKAEAKGARTWPR